MGKIQDSLCLACSLVCSSQVTIVSSVMKLLLLQLGICYGPGGGGGEGTPDFK